MIMTRVERFIQDIEQQGYSGTEFLGRAGRNIQEAERHFGDAHLSERR